MNEIFYAKTKLFTYLQQSMKHHNLPVINLNKSQSQ